MKPFFRAHTCVCGQLIISEAIYRGYQEYQPLYCEKCLPEPINDFILKKMDRAQILAEEGHVKAWVYWRKQNGEE